ncbi:adenosine deaminase [Enterococcus faecalis]|jgi:adenosine deaminase|uniref:adenosine deaminase n=1 Tax=Enterococcus TaxID=1350 RepID=UPI0013B06C15|nr:adenosine deaminase [Enterococcus faecalis]EGO2575484.1 adenosine deaminase [Enterococcus faecalis]EGO2617570.1 adenosine deaminase [Enterococcus faecalis]EGO5080634.1 adenosine deaminase [Enterococcus faecalis]EGO5178695.1 adenosine deaminase [Enterococcus faecalis]EGO6123525.1 adenosine deaminase [Enterococcus faecalis]
MEAIFFMEESCVRQLPKIELHCHLDGSIRPTTLRTIAEKQNIPLPQDEQALKELVVAPEKCTDLNDYLTRFDFVLTCLQTAEALQAAAYDVISQAAEDGVAYIEVRFAPSQHTEKGLRLPEIVTAVLTGLKQGEEDFGVKSNALLCGMRHDQQQAIEKIVHLAHDFRETGVVGFDLAGNEVDFPPYTFEDVLALANQLSIPLTLHAGECGCGKNVADAVTLGATRIGHGIALKDTPEYLALLKEKKVLLEMCPTSNFQTGTVKTLAEYPFQQFIEAGLAVCINTDNRTVSDTTLTKEFMKLATWYQLSYDEMKQLTKNALAGAFLSPDEKKLLNQKIDQAYLF